MSLEKLIEIASDPIIRISPVISPSLRSLGGALVAELLKLLARKNGFYAFESSLHIFPTQSKPGEIGLEDWNSNLWRNEYQGLADGMLFFAEDVFGGQFCMKSGEIYTFDPETGHASHIAKDLEGWADVILADYEVLTGYPLAHEWQNLKGRLSPGERLVPKIPFVAGGEFSIENLYLLDSVKAMQSRANLAVQIKDVPDGQAIRLKVVE
jgi:hypothetical protein